jgi:hypothetical protein
MPAVFAVTIVLTVKRRHHRSVLVLCFIQLAFLAAFAVTDMFSAPGTIETARDAVVLSYGAVFTLVPLWWFTKGRRNPAGSTQPFLT